MYLPFKVFHNFYRLAILDNLERAKNPDSMGSSLAEVLEDEM
jgi:hypothetical protein